MQKRSSLAAVLIVVVAGAGCAGLSTPEAGMPPELAGKVAAIGRVIDPPKSAPLYIPLQENEPYKGVKVARDVRYGPAERNLLDVFASEGGGASRPVLVFVHGGGFTGGNKRAPGSPFYDNIALWAARNGLVGVNMTYRVAPAAVWPSGPEDISRAVEWMAANIATHGGDPNRVYLMGSSAGATHVADYVANTALRKPGSLGVAGAILLSGIYDLSSFGVHPQYQQYFGADTARYGERSSIHGLSRSPIPLLLSHAEYDPLPFEQQTKQLSEALCKSPRGCQAFVVLPKHNHLTQVQSINTGDTTLTRHVLKFVKQY
jgi:acetyl esterase/lipase